MKAADQQLGLQRDPDCGGTLLAGGLLNRAGVMFGMSADYARLELLMRADTFDKMAAKLAKLSLA